MTSESSGNADDMQQNVDNMARYIDDMPPIKEENIQLTRLDVDDMPREGSTQVDVINTGSEAASGNCVGILLYESFIISLISGPKRLRNCFGSMLH